MANRKKSTFERLSGDRLNRQQRRELARTLTAKNPGLEIVNRNVAGIDVGNESHYVAVASGYDLQPVRELAQSVRHRDGSYAIHGRVLDGAL
jgi:hypothetical protein